MIVTLADEGLRLAGTGGEPLDTWPYPSLSQPSDELRRGPVRLVCGEARLTVEDPGFALALHQAAPGLQRAPRRRLLYGTAATVLLLAVVGGLWWAMPRIAEEIAWWVPPAWEEKLAAGVEAQAWFGRRCRGPAGVAALDAMTRRLTDGIASPYKILVSVRDTNLVNAFALPGGHIVLLRGLLREAESADEVAGVLAHEITHTLKRHSTQALIANSALSLLFELTVGNGTGASLGLILTTLSYTRAMEREADEGALLLLRRAGIGSDGFAAFFERLSRQEAVARPAYLSSHPPTEERLAAVRSSADGRPAGRNGPALPAEDWAALKAICTESQ